MAVEKNAILERALIEKEKIIARLTGDLNAAKKLESEDSLGLWFDFSTESQQQPAEMSKISLNNTDSDQTLL